VCAAIELAKTSSAIRGLYPAVVVLVKTW
jgi:hypothetical protein